ncbi:MAG: hypothetical protein CM15mP81_06900 [Alphaproteobacteria bacterium]|jgi:hypothetical protein|nr:MAG: hypothetical protein CM15mP81_06900 [Alphaproteobacteria bacterium]|tara:strand:- start:2686 stop:3069 length:384 start_codon:yes stop_codon:yes gene_type:complete
MNNKKTNDQNKSAELYPRLNINFLKVIVIVLGLAIFSMISIIVFKILRGDLNKNNTEFTNTSDDFHSEYILELPNIKSIKSIALDNENILIFSEDNLSSSLITITKNNKIKIIKLQNSNVVKFNKLK